MSLSTAAVIVSACALVLPGTASAQQRSPAFPPPPPPPLIAPGPALDTPAAPRLLRVAAQPQTDDQFEAISEIPLEERLPAAPMLVAAYVFTLLAFFVYVFSLARRLGAVKQDIGRLEAEMKRSGRT